MSVRVLLFVVTMLLLLLFGVVVVRCCCCCCLLLSFDLLTCPTIFFFCVPCHFRAKGPVRSGINHGIGKQRVCADGEAAVLCRRDCGWHHLPQLCQLVHMHRAAHAGEERSAWVWRCVSWGRVTEAFVVCGGKRIV